MGSSLHETVRESWSHSSGLFESKWPKEYTIERKLALQKVRERISENRQREERKQAKREMQMERSSNRVTDN